MFKLIFAWIVTTTIWLFVWIPFYVLGFLLTWIGLIFTNRSSEHMWFPWWFWDSNHGINGTLGYNNLNWIGICNPWVLNTPNPIASAKKLIDNKTGNERSYKNRWIWTTWRNPVTNVSLYLIGVKIDKPVTKNQYKFGPFIFESIKSGFLWTYSLSIKYNEKRGFYYAFGWKFADPSEGRARFIYRISPYRLFE